MNSAASNGILEWRGLRLGWALDCGDLHAPAATFGPEAMRHRKAVRTQDGGWRMVWSGHPLLGDTFTVTVVWSPLEDGWSGRIAYAGLRGKLRVEAIRFPVVSLDYPAEGVRILAGQSQGWIYRFAPNAADGDLVDPHAYCSFQMAAALLGGHGLYLDHQDSRYNIKFYRWRKADGRLEYQGIHPCPCPKRRPTSGRLAFASSVRLFVGDWFEAARMYRAWALTAPNFRRRIPARKNPLREIALWLWNRGDARTVIPPAEKIAREAGVPVALDWYWWHHNPYDTDYPDYWPPREGEDAFRNSLRRLKRHGIYTQVYVNGLAWDLEAKSFPQGGRESVVVSRDGTPYAVEFNCYTHRRLGYACGEGAPFQAKIREVLQRLAACGLPGIYLDMIGCATMHPCYNPAHRHAPGGGNYQVRGYRRFVKSLRREHPGMPFSTEACNEAYLDLFEAVILLSSSMERCGNQDWIDCVPAFSAIYHGATALFGNYALPDGIPPWDPLWPPRERWKHEREWDVVYPDQFYLEAARTVIWGMQPTVCNFQLKHTEGRFTKMYRFLRDLARFYYAHRDFLFDGEMLPPGTLECEEHPMEFLQRGLFTTEAKHTVLRRTLPAVLHSRWKAPDGRKALVLINYTARLQRARFADVETALPPRSARCVENTTG